MTNPFAPPGCSCHDAASLLRDTLGGRAPKPCAVHDVTVDRDAELRDALIDRLVAEHQAATAVAKRAANPEPTLKQLLESALVGAYDPPPPSGNAPVVALNASPDQFPALAGMNTDTPPDAA